GKKLQRNTFFRLDAQDQQIGRDIAFIAIKDGQRRGVKLNGDLGDAFGQPLSRPQIERHTRPTPVVHEKGDGRVGVGLGIRTDARLLPETGDILAADGGRTILAGDSVCEHLLRFHDAYRAQQLGTLVAYRVRPERRAGLHGDRRQYLPQVILDHVAQRAGFLVIRAAAFHPDGFRRGDLHVVHIIPTPQRLEDAVAEAKREDVLYGLLAEIMVDAVDLGFVEDFMQLRAQLLSAGQVVPERLFHYNAAPALAFSRVGRAPALRNPNILAWLRGKIKQNIAPGVALAFDLLQA